MASKRNKKKRPGSRPQNAGRAQKPKRPPARPPLRTFTDIGPPGGPVVVLCHPAPGSSHLDPDPEATAAAGVRLVGVDRAGYGGSPPPPAGSVPNIAGYADDVVAVLDRLAIDRPVAVAGWSAGGRVALAVAAR
ncbi:MAG TPA: alpha/beta fold hydrolase, partial [Acidimicrobiales bacterium]